MEDLFLFYMCMNVLLVFKIVYSIKLILKKFKRYSNTNFVISKMTYGGLVFFNLCFSIVQATGITEDAYTQLPSSYTGLIFTGCLAVVCIYLVYAAHYFNEKVR